MILTLTSMIFKIFNEYDFALIALLAVSYGTAYASLRPVMYSLPPSYGNSQMDLELIHSWLQLGDVGSLVVGQAAGALIFSYSGLPLVIGVSLASLLWIYLIFIKSEGIPENRLRKKTTLKDIILKTKEGFTVVYNHKSVFHLFIFLIGVNLFFPGTAVLLPFLTQDILELPLRWVGYFSAIQGLGFFCGSLAKSTIPHYKKSIYELHHRSL